ncbi:MAG TPA: hypothetical protein VH416_01855 [Gaiellaceae bacterium]|jgi:hypothetical protein
MRSPQLYESLRRYCLGAFAVFSAELDAGADLPFAFEEHGSYGRPTLYEYRPLVRGFVEARASRLAERADARMALEDLRAEPAAAIFARAHAGPRPDDDRALYLSVLVPLLVRTAEGCGGFDWDDTAFDRAYLELETSLFGEGHSYGAVAPLVGLSVAGTLELAPGLRIRATATGELAAHWPEATGLLPPGFGREPDRLCVLELERSLDRREAEPPDASAELADAVTALRLATAAPAAAGPVVFERLDWRPFGVRPALPIAATQPAGEPTRLDRFRGALAGELLPGLGGVEDDHELAEALDRWELALFQADPFRSEQLRLSLEAALGRGDGLWAASVRAAALLGENGRERAELLDRLRRLDRADAADVVRRALVELLLHGDRVQLVAALDETLLGLRQRPASPAPARAKRAS